MAHFRHLRYPSSAAAAAFVRNVDVSQFFFVQLVASVLFFVKGLLHARDVQLAMPFGSAPTFSIKFYGT